MAGRVFIVRTIKNQMSLKADVRIIKYLLFSPLLYYYGSFTIIQRGKFQGCLFDSYRWLENQMNSTNPADSLDKNVSVLICSSLNLFCAKMTNKFLSYIKFLMANSEHILRNQNLIIGLDSYSRQRFIYLDPILIYISL